jgi:hypothetical protein
MSIERILFQREAASCCCSKLRFFGGSERVARGCQLTAGSFRKTATKERQLRAFKRAAASWKRIGAATGDGQGRTVLLQSAQLQLDSGLVAEETLARKHHRDAVLIRGGDYLCVAH